MSDPDAMLVKVVEAVLPLMTGAVRGTLTQLLDDAEARGKAEGVADERAQVVADLRMRASAGELSAVTERTLRVLADLYERGEHEEAT